MHTSLTWFRSPYFKDPENRNEYVSEPELKRGQILSSVLRTDIILVFPLYQEEQVGNPYLGRVCSVPGTGFSTFHMFPGNLHNPPGAHYLILLLWSEETELSTSFEETQQARKGVGIQTQVSLTPKPGFFAQSCGQDSLTLTSQGWHLLSQAVEHCRITPGGKSNR